MAIAAPKCDMHGPFQQQPDTLTEHWGPTRLSGTESLSARVSLLMCMCGTYYEPRQ